MYIAGLATGNRFSDGLAIARVWWRLLRICCVCVLVYYDDNAYSTVAAGRTAGHVSRIAFFKRQTLVWEEHASFLLIKSSLCFKV